MIGRWPEINSVGNRRARTGNLKRGLLYLRCPDLEKHSTLSAQHLITINLRTVPTN